MCGVVNNNTNTTTIPIVSTTHESWSESKPICGRLSIQLSLSRSPFFPVCPCVCVLSSGFFSFCDSVLHYLSTYVYPRSLSFCSTPHPRHVLFTLECLDFFLQNSSRGQKYICTPVHNEGQPEGHDKRVHWMKKIVPSGGSLFNGGWWWWFHVVIVPTNVEKYPPSKLNWKTKLLFLIWV